MRVKSSRTFETAMPPDLVSQLNATSASSFGSDGERLQVIAAAKALLARLYDPVERLEDLHSSQVPLLAELKVFADLQVFQKWQDRNRGEPVNADTLASWTGVSVPLMKRLMRHLAIENVLTEIGEDKYAMSPFATSFQSQDVSCWIDYAFDFSMPTFSKLPDFLASTAYKDPTDHLNGPFHFAKDCQGMEVFDYLRDHPRVASTFNACMSSYTAKRASWLQFFPLKDYLLANSRETEPFLVDVGGNVGHDIQKVFDVLPELGGRLVLQDRPEVIKNAVCDDSIRRVGLDFFTPQPIKGARIYYLHSVLHDWNDEQARRILENIRQAMVSGYSKILLNENVIASRNPIPQTVMFDMVMMTIAAKERSEADWRELIESAGLKIQKIWTSPIARESIIEVDLAP